MTGISTHEAYERAREIAGAIVSGEVSAFAGAMTIWREVIDHLGPTCPDDLWPFKSNASAIEDAEWNAREGGARADQLILRCEHEIMEAARRLSRSA